MNKCPICKDTYEGYGNNPWPLNHEKDCCNDCNLSYVVPARMFLYELNG